jgi:hypothetical protein
MHAMGEGGSFWKTGSRRVRFCWVYSVREREKQPGRETRTMQQMNLEGSNGLTEVRSGFPIGEPTKTRR